MEQPDLGKKIAELRKAKGFTQEELVEKCNLSVRTLQRIESGEVTPRSYTIRTIFAALDYTIYDSSEKISNKFSKTGFIVSNWLEQFYRYVFDLFNLKTNTMKKISILTVLLFAIVFGLFALCPESKAQKAEKAIKAIADSQTKINNWLNNGQIDSLLTLYQDDACDLPNRACGKKELSEVIKKLVEDGCRIIEFKNLSINVCDTIAIQKYYNVCKCGDNLFRAEGLTEWHLIKGKWLIINDVWINR